MLYTLGMKLLAMSALVLALSGGSAFAGRHGGGGGGGHSGGGGGHVGGAVHGGGGGHIGGGAVVRGGGFRGGVVGRGYAGGYRGGYGYGARRPIYVGRPFIRERYFDYRYRPRLLVENYAAMPGYFWTAGSWQWDGQEWIWTAGHYEPDAAYDQGYVDESY